MQQYVALWVEALLSNRKNQTVIYKDHKLTTRRCSDSYLERGSPLCQDILWRWKGAMEWSSGKILSPRIAE